MYVAYVETIVYLGHVRLDNGFQIIVHNIELTPGRGGQIVRSAGLGATLMSVEGKYAQLKLPSGEVRKVLAEGFASIGAISNPEHMNIKIGKAGRHRHMGKREERKHNH